RLVSALGRVLGAEALPFEFGASISLAGRRRCLFGHGIGFWRAEDRAGGKVNDLPHAGFASGPQKVLSSLHVHRFEEFLVLGQGHLRHTMENNFTAGAGFEYALLGANVAFGKLNVSRTILGIGKIEDPRLMAFSAKPVAQERAEVTG